MDVDEAKRLVGARAAELVNDGDVLGLGTGSTVAHFLDALGERVADEGLDIRGVATSERTASQCEALGIDLTTLDEEPSLDLCVDGADEVAPGLDLIKGLGAALFREKVVAEASERFVVIVDASKEVERLGIRAPVPVEVPAFAVATVQRRLGDLKPELRRDGDAAVMTDGGNWLLDLSTGPIDDARALAARLDATVGVLEHGLFLGMADQVLVASGDGVRERSD